MRILVELCDYAGKLRHRRHLLYHVNELANEEVFAGVFG